MRHSLTAFALLGTLAAAHAQSSRVLVFGAEGNRLNAYDGRSAPPAAKQTVIPSSLDDPPGLDLNAQICFFPDGSRRFVGGEDTDQDLGRPQGWGIFQLAGDRIGEMSATEVGRLVPTFQAHLVSNVENYGCGFLSDGRILTTDVGDQYPGFDGNGQLIVWFPPFDSFTGRYCKLDVGIATAGGMYVDAADNIYVASNRPDTVPPTLSAAGIYRYSPPFPTSDDAAGGCGQVDSTGAPLATAVTKQLFIPADAHVTTPSAIVRSPADTFYVSSVFNGVIAEYAANGAFIRRILEPPPGESLPYSTGTPYGIGIDSDSTLYYADLGVGAGPPPGPVDDQGSEFRIRVVGGNPQPPELLDDGLDFPDGIGVLEIPIGALDVKSVSLRARSGSGVDNGRMRLRGEFATPPAFSFPPSFTVRVKDALAFDRSVTFINCTTRNGRVRCSQIAADGTFKANLSPMRSRPVTRLRVSYQRLTTDGPFAGPIEVRLNHGEVSRTDVVTNCRTRGSGLGCRE